MADKRSAYRIERRRFDPGPGLEPGMGGSPGDVSENPVTQEKRKKGWRKSCDVGEATEVLENEL